MKNFLKSIFLKDQSKLKESNLVKPPSSRNSSMHEEEGILPQNEILYSNNPVESHVVKITEVSVYNGANSKDLSANGNSVIVYRNQDNGIDFFGLLNPHGLSGKEISSVLVVFIQNYMAENARKLSKLEKESDIELFMKSLVSRANNDLLNNGIDLNFSGTSLTCLLIMKQTVYIAWLGNARAILYRQISDEKKFAIELTVDHVPENREERYRIFEHGGIVQRVVSKGNKEQGPLRIWEGRIENGPGLHITRSLGDTKSTKLGVISEPEVQHFRLKDSDKFIVLGTENIWSIIHSTQMAFYVKKLTQQKPDQFSDFAKMIIKKLQKLWTEVEANPEYDLKIDKGIYDPKDSALVILSLSHLKTNGEY
jgi:serine/threonine protein phosphatase PrpC